MIGAEHLSVNRQRSHEERFRLGVAALRFVECCQIVEADGDIGMVGAELLFANRQRSRLQRFRLGIAALRL